jgi:hypothetical protein
MGWLGDLVRQNGCVSFDHLDVTVPCCRTVIELDNLHYEEPIGFARFEISAMNPTRARDELDAGELARVADLLGHPVAQILALLIRVGLRSSIPSTRERTCRQGT